MSTEHEPPNEKRPVRVLLVEDDEDDYLLTRDLIADMNHRQYTLDWVPDFDTAVEAIGRGEHDVYLFDYRLGAHDGIELLREAKKMRGPAILLTGQGASDLDVAALQAGASDYLDKQRLDAGSLERAILYGLHQKRRQDELERLVQERTETLHRANAELRESEERLAAIFNQSTTGIAQTDLMGRFILVNDRYCDIVGRSRDVLLTLRMQDLTHPDDLPGNLEQFREAVNGLRCSFTVEKRYVKPDGSWVWVHNEVSVIRDAAGMPRSVAATVADITERKRQETLLAEQHQLLERIASNQPTKECFDALTDTVTRLQPTARAALLIANTDRSVMGHAFSVHLAPTFDDAIKGAPINDLPIGTCGTAIHTGQPITCQDIEGSEHWSPMWRELCLTHGIRACHSQPVFGHEGHAIASFFLCLGEAREPTDWERRIAEVGAHLAGIVIERDRAEESLRERTHRLDLLARTAHRLLTSQEPERHLLESIFQDIARLIDMEMFYHYRPSEQPGLLRLDMHGGITDEDQRRFATMRYGELLCGRVAEWQTRIIVEDLQHSPHPGSEVLRAAGATSYAGFPLLAHGELIGTIAFISGRRSYLREGDVQMIQTVCDQLAVTLERARLERELRASEARLRLALDGADLGSWDIDVRTGAARWNRRHAAMQGYEPEGGPVSMQKWKDRFHPDDLERVLTSIEHARQDQGLFAEEHRILRADTAEVRWLSLYGRFSYDESDEPVRFSGVSLDITERKQAEQALHWQARRHELLSDTAARLLGSEDPQGLVEDLCRTIMEFLDCDVFFNFLADDEAGRLRLNACAGISQEEVRQLEWLDSGVAVCGCVARDGRRIVAEDVGHSDDRRTELVKSYGIQAYCCHPLQMQGRVIGTLSFGTRSRSRFSTDDIDVMKVVADLVAVAMHRVETERALRTSEQQMRFALTSGHLGSWQWDVRTGECIWNREHFEFLGLMPTPGGKAHIDIFVNAMHPDDRQPVQQELWRARRERTPYQPDFRVIRADTEEIRWIAGRGEYVFNEEGEATHSYGVMTDITERKRAEEALRQSEEFNRSLMKSSPDCVKVLDLDGHLVLMNDPGQCQMEIDDFASQCAGKDWWSLWPAEAEESIRSSIAAAGSGTTTAFEAFCPTAKGRPKWWEVTVSPVRDTGERVVHLLAISRDITERKQTEAELTKAQKQLQHWNVELEQAVSEKTAELRQSQERLRALASELTLAEQRERKRIATELHDHLQQLLVFGKITIGQGKRIVAGVPGGDTLLKQVDDMLSDALTYTRTLVADLSPTVLRDHGLAAALQWLGSYMQKHHQSVTVTVPDGDGPKLPEDQVLLLFQCVRELLINSSKHAATGEATVRMSQADGMLRIEVQDDGQGFDLAAAAAAADIPSGGISSKFGLFSIQERMKALAGSFEIQSAPGRGTIATLTLPFASHREERVHRLESSHVLPRPQHDIQPHATIRVLMVDDHAMVRQGLRSVLDAYADIQVVGEAGNGEEAICLMEQLKPTVVIMDISMPRMNGIEATEHITRRYPETVIIGLSVNAADENQEAMKRAGAVCLIPKEAAAEELYAAILRRRKQQTRAIEL